MQQPNAGSTRARSALRWCPCASCIWLLHPAPILVPKMVLTLCNLRWWCFSLHQLAKILHLQSWSSSPAATCAGGVFLGALAHLLMCAQTNRHTLQLALCGGGGIYIYIYIYIPTYIRTEVRLRHHKGARFARPNYYSETCLRQPPMGQPD